MPLDKNCRLTRRHRINARHKCHWPIRLCEVSQKRWPNFKRKSGTALLSRLGGEVGRLS